MQKPYIGMKNICVLTSLGSPFLYRMSENICQDLSGNRILNPFQERIQKNENVFLLWAEDWKPLWEAGWDDPKAKGKLKSSFPSSKAWAGEQDGKENANELSFSIFPNKSPEKKKKGLYFNFTLNTMCSNYCSYGLRLMDFSVLLGRAPSTGGFKGGAGG